MINQYDENLQENDFFKEILNNHNDLIKKVIDDGWIICIPCSESIKDVTVTAQDIFDHILIPNAEKSKKHYCTLNKRELLIEDSIITPISDDLPKATTKILFEETFYVENGRYTVWCVHKPINCKFGEYEQLNSSINCLNDCVDLLWSENFNRNIHEQIYERTENFFKLNTNLAFEVLQIQKDLVGGLYSQCLQVALSNKRFLKDLKIVNNIKIAVEAYMQNCNKSLFYSVCTGVFHRDAKLNKVIQNLSDLEYEDLRMPKVLWDLSSLAKCELGKINKYHTILGKIHCLKRAFVALTNYGFKKGSVTSDDLLIVFVYAILKLGVNNWFGNLTYIKEFNFSTAETCDETSFLITTLEASLLYIKDGSILHDITNKKTTDLVYNEIKSGSIEYVKRILENEDLNDNLKLCHPLCICQNCVHQIDYPKTKENTLVHQATLCNKLEIVEYLISKKCDLNFVDKNGQAPLHYAASNGLQDILLLLAHSGADLNIKNNEENTPLHISVNNGHENCVKALLYCSNQIDVNCVNHWGNTPLHLASKWGFIGIIKILLESGAHALVKNKGNLKPVDLGTNYHVFNLFEFASSLTVVKPKKKVRFKEENECKLYRTFDNRCVYGIRPKNLQQSKKVDLLFKAIEKNDLPLTCFYLGFPIPTVTEIKSGTCHPLCTCPKCQNEEEITELPKTAEILNVNTCNANGYTSLHIAAKFGCAEILRLLLDTGALPNVQTHHTQLTPLHLAAIHQKVSIIKELLKCGGCNLDVQDARGNTAIFYACSKNDIKIFELLLKQGADVTLKNNENVNVLKEAQRKMLSDIIRLVKDNKSNDTENIF